MFKLTLTFNMHRRSPYSTTPVLYPRVFTDKLQTCQHQPGHPIPACNLSFGTGMYSVWNKIEKFILMHGECKQKWKKTTQKEYCKNTMQNIKRLVYCHCMEYSTRSNILSEVHSSEKNMNLRYFLSSLIFSRNVRPHISYIGNTHEPFYFSICISTLHAYAVYNVYF